MKEVAADEISSGGRQTGSAPRNHNNHYSKRSLIQSAHDAALALGLLERDHDEGRGGGRRRGNTFLWMLVKFAPSILQ